MFILAFLSFMCFFWRRGCASIELSKLIEITFRQRIKKIQINGMDVGISPRSLPIVRTTFHPTHPSSQRFDSKSMPIDPISDIWPFDNHSSTKLRSFPEKVALSVALWLPISWIKYTREILPFLEPKRLRHTSWKCRNQNSHICYHPNTNFSQIWPINLLPMTKEYQHKLRRFILVTTLPLASDTAFA